MTFDEINERVQEQVKLISISRKSLGEAAERAADFLVTIALLTDFKRELEIDKAKLTTLQEAQYARAMSGSSAKNVTDRKAEAQSNEDYTDVREKVEEIDAGISWCRSYMKIFENAHLTYRQQSRD